MFKSRGPHRQRSMSRWQKLSVVSLANKQRPHLSVDTSMLRELAQGGAEFLKQWYANQTGKDPWWASDSHTFDGGACAVLEQEALSPRLSKPGGSTGGPDVTEESLRLQKAFKQNASRRMRSFDKFAQLLGTCDTRDHSVFTFGAGVAGKETGPLAGSRTQLMHESDLCTLSRLSSCELSDEAGRGGDLAGHRFVNCFAVCIGRARDSRGAHDDGGDRLVGAREGHEQP